MSKFPEDERCARCWARGKLNCEVCNYPGPRLANPRNYGRQEEYLHGCWVAGHTNRVCEDGTKGCNRVHPLRRNAMPVEPTLSDLGPIHVADMRARAREAVDAQEARLQEVMASHGVHPSTPEEIDAWEARRMRSGYFRTGHLPEDMTKRERLVRGLLASSLSCGAIVHYMGVYARAIPTP